ncbi:metallophosphoesterase [Microbacterium sp. CPCC 204701]|uniref:metallophosphoesterase n=1 Tax=Microbacterium sp. CPCC 204701 TaxID=2493084 RepID=UPI000FDCC8DE|nr:metallophosphoesterase [Microbacterium sp. CPCC 204701]
MTRSHVRSRWLTRILSAAVGGALIAAGGLAPTAAVAALPGLDGDGTTRAPYQIDSADDLRVAASAINADPGSYAGAAYRLTADIDFGGETFEGIDTFRGVFEGAGHVISDIVYGHSTAGASTAGRLGFFRHVTEATVRNLVLDGVTADNGTRSDWVAGIAVISTRSTLTGNSVLGATLTARNAEKVAGIAAELDGGTASNNRVDAVLTANKMAGGIASYSKNGVTVSNNLVRADLTVVVNGGANGTRGVDAGLIVNYPGNPSGGSTFAGNVAYGGSITYSGKVDGFVGRIVGYTGYDGWTATDNRANAAITIAGAPVAGPGTKNQHGSDATAAELADRATYEALGWDFTNAWRFDETLQHPVPNFVYSLFGNGTAESPYEIATEDDLEFLAVQLNAGDARYSGAKHYLLSGDLDFAGRAPWPGIDEFGGVFDGAGHRIANITYGPAGEGSTLGFFRRVTDATVRNLVLDGVTADNGAATQFVAGLAVYATRSTLTGNSVLRADLRGSSAEKVGGLVAELDGGSVSNNWVDVAATARRMPGGAVAYSKNGANITNNLVQAELTVVQAGGAAGTRGTDAGLVVSYPGNPSSGSAFSGNVALSGSVAYSGLVDGFAGRIVGYTGYDGWTASNNLANASIPVGGATVSGPGMKNQHGADTSDEALGQRATYEELGWDFASAWRFDDQLGHPIPRYVMPGEVPNRVTVTFYGDAATQRAFTWYSTVDSDTAVAMLSTDREFPEGSSTFEVAASNETSEHGELLYRAVAEGLEPGTRYYYRLGDAVHGVWSTVGTFQTADGEDDFTFIGLTDTQSQNLAEAQLSAATMAKSLAAVPEAEFITHSGDHVERGAREQDWIDLLDSARATFMSTTLAPAAGNHDEAHRSFIDHFTVETPNGQSPDRGAYYSFDYNDAHFMVLNTNEDGSTNQQGAQAVSDAQVEWLRQDAAAARAAGAKWLILSVHKGPYTSANHLDDYDVVAMRDVLMPVIDEADIDLVLQGHDHVMSRTKVLASDPAGVENARVVETTKYTEVINGKRIEYNVDPDGTIFLLPNTAGAKHYAQKTSARGFDLEQYLQLFDRVGEQATENFAAIRVTDDELTVDMYDIRNQSSPRVFESFGIDRSLSPVEDVIEGLPEVGALAPGDADALRDARVAVEELRPAQRAALANLAKLEELEQRMRELNGLVATDGSVVAWAKADAESRQAITVRNDTRSDLTDVPVQLRIADTPNVEAGSLALFSASAAPVAYEVETWNPGGISTVWATASRLPAQSATTLWAYYGGAETRNDPTEVWNDYALVEHFAGDLTAGEEQTDSSGTATGLLVGADLTSTVSDRGTGQARFEGSRLQYGGDVGGDHDRISISGVYSLTADDISALSGNAPVIAKESATGDGRATLWQGVIKGESRLGTRLAGNSFQFGDVDLGPRFDLPADGEPHLVTQTYDGMTYSVFIDGREVHSQMVEYRTTFGDHAVLTTIGDYYTNTGELSSPFRGVIDEVQIAGVAFTPELEAFRYANYLGDVVSYGELAQRTAEPVTLIVGTPVDGTEVEAGLVEFTGSVSERATLTATVGGEEVFAEETDAGVFRVRVPVDATGEQDVQLRARSVSDAGKESDPATVRLSVSDTIAPAQPSVSDTAEDAAPGSTEVTLTTTPQTESREEVEVRFYADDLDALDASNTLVRSGTTTDRVPDALTPTSGTATGDLLTTTVGSDANPFQIYEISLTDAEAAQDEFHLVWKGTADDRRVSAYVYDHVAGAWVLKASGSDADGGTVALDVVARADENAVAENTLHLLVWRGLTAQPFGPQHDYDSEPEVADYDWSFDHVPDSQLYTQATPQMFVDQMQYVADRVGERKTSIVVHAGDLVNREYLSQEYQWHNAEQAMSKLDDIGVPYLVSWGNHDYSDHRNGRVMLPKWYPMSRFQESLDGSPWQFGGSHSIDNFYYTAEIEGAKLLMLTVGYFSADNAGDPGLAWARDVIAQHPDHAVILATHQSVGAGTNNWANGNVTSQLIDPFPNVKLVLGGHITGTGVATRTAAGGAQVYGILTDYQGRVYGGQQYLKSLSVDAENGLLYVNTYSPHLQKTTSDGVWHQPVSEAAVPGFHGADTENYVLELDFGGSTTRTLATESLTLAAGAPAEIGDVQTVVGDEPASVRLRGAQAGAPYEWYAEVRDAAGHLTRSSVSTFAVTDAQAPSAPRDVVATVGGDTVTVRWSAPDSDGGSPVQQYELRLSDGTTVTVDGGIRTATVRDLAPGEYHATVVARNAAGASPASDPSNTVVVAEGGGEDPGEPAALAVTGSLVPGGEIVVRGSGFTPEHEYAIELRSTPLSLGTARSDASGAFELRATIPAATEPGAHTIAAMLDGADVATLQVQIAAAPSGGDSSGSGGNGLSGEIATTGGDLSGLVGWGIAGVLLLLGGTAFVLIRRRRTA